jgi:hypothetical protein
MGPVSQDRVISTTRGSEVVSDPTNRGDAKERCFTSCLSTERLAALAS